MEGVQFVIDDKGGERYVLLDLSRWGEVWEDIYDILVSQSRRGEPTVSWKELKREMEQEKRKTNRV